MQFHSQKAIAALLLLPLIMCSEALTQPEKKPITLDLTREIAAARAVQSTPLPAESAMKEIMAEVNGTPIRLGDLLEEVVFLYAAPMTEVLARQKAMALESGRRGIRVGKGAFETAAEQFLRKNRRGRSLTETLRAHRLSFHRFENLMKLNAAVDFMFKMDQGKEPGEKKGREWAQNIQKRYEIRMDPAHLEKGTHALVTAEWSLKKVLENYITGKTSLQVVEGDAARTVRFRLTLPDGSLAHLVTVNTVGKRYLGPGERTGSLSLAEAFSHWKGDRFKVQALAARGSTLLVVRGAKRRFPEYRFPDAPVRVEARVQGRELLAARMPDLKLRHLDEALQSRARYVAFLQAMKARKVSVSEERVAARIEKERDKYRGGEFTWEQAIKLVGRNIQLETRRFRVADGVDQIMKTGTVSDRVLEAYYEAHIDHFGKATVTASHILISEVDPETGRVDFEKARDKIKAVYARLKAGADFQDMIQEYSQDRASRTSGGDVGMFTLVSAYDPEFCRLAFALREGEISPPVRTRQGYHIIYCRKRTPPDREAFPFEKVKDIVLMDRQEDLRKRWLEQHVYGKMKVLSRVDKVMKGLGTRRKESL